MADYSGVDVTERICARDACDKPARARGLCKTHYQAWRRETGYRQPTQIERFWAKVDRGSDDECWPWTGPLNWAGYGAFKLYPGRGVGAVHASRASFLFAHGYLPPIVRHTCDNAACVNPAHLLPGTQQDNMNDMKRRGRSPRGERSGNAKLTDDLVRELRRRYAAGGETFYGLAREVGMTRTPLRRAIRGESWRHVT